ncbi:MAG: ribonuclease P protein component [bacterium]|nr:ribonuclease P protein component [bacterium]
MLPKNRRLTRSEYWQVSTQGRSLTQPDLTVKYLPNQTDRSRWAVVTSAKLSKLATVRNQLRRRIFRQLATVTDLAGWDVIIFPRSSMLNLVDEKFNAAVDQMVSTLSGLA